MSRPKELRFFADEGDPEGPPRLRRPADRRIVAGSRGQWRRGLDWYRRHFDPAAPVRGESSPIYASPWYLGCAERIARVVPDVKLVLCVRDPVERAISHYHHSRSFGWESRSIDEALADVDGFYTGRSRYAEALNRFRRHFDSDRILVVDAEDLDRHRRTTLIEVFSFLGVDSNHWSPRLEQRWNASRTRRGLRWQLYSRLRQVPGWARLASLPPRTALPMLERATGRRPSDEHLPAPSAAVAERLTRTLAPDAALFRELTDRDFPEWSV